jgi:Fe(3+) dicitrate transport protein
MHRGFAPPRPVDVINGTTGATIDLDAELSWNYELGVRASPRPGVSVDATFFVMDFSNQTIPASIGGGMGSELVNGGATLHVGGEVAARLSGGKLTGSPHDLFLTLAYTYLPIARFEGPRLSDTGIGHGVSVTGNRLPYAPEHLLSATLGYAHPSGVDARIELVYTGSMFSDDLNTVAPTPSGQEGLIPEVLLVNAAVTVEVRRLRSKFFLSAKNVFDRTYIVSRTRGVLPGMPAMVFAGMKTVF